MRLIQTNKLKLHIRLITACLVAAFGLGFILLPGHAHAATITVGGACTLDDAVASLNAASNQSGCAGAGAYGAGDTIDLPAGTFPYADAAVLTVPATIHGAGMGQTIVDYGGNNAGLRWQNTSGTVKSALIRDLSFIDANFVSGNSAYINVNNVAFTMRNVEFYSTNSSYSTQSVVTVHADAIDTASSLIENIYVHNIANMNNVVRHYTSAGHSFTNNILRNSVISSVTQNQGTTISFAVYDDGGTIGGEVYNNSIQDAIFTVGGGVFAAEATASGTGDATSNVTYRNNTITTTSSPVAVIAPVLVIAIATSGNAANSTVNLQNNLITNSFNDTGCTLYHAGAGGTENTSIISLGGNIVNDNGCSAFLTEPTDHNNVTNIASFVGPLANNGGGTLTNALLPGSPAIDAGVVNGVSTDQRGIARPQGSGFDVGAFEYVTPTVPGGNTGGDGAIPAAPNTGVRANSLTAISLVTFAGLLSLIFAARSRRETHRL
jgi:hypothetical protein